jgi:hypothetical protein
VNILNKSASYALISVMHVQKNVRSMRVTWNTANSVLKYAADVQRNVVEFRDKQQKCILRSSANTVLKEQSKANTSLMEDYRLVMTEERRSYMQK